jgi:hypothetical protein
MSQFGENFDDGLSFNDMAAGIREWVRTAPTEELIRVLGNGAMDLRVCWHRQLLAIRGLDTTEVAPWA